MTTAGNDVEWMTARPPPLFTRPVVPTHDRCTCRMAKFGGAMSIFTASVAPFLILVSETAKTCNLWSRMRSWIAAPFLQLPPALNVPNRIVAIGPGFESMVNSKNATNDESKHRCGRGRNGTPDERAHCSIVDVL